MKALSILQPTARLKRKICTGHKRCLVPLSDVPIPRRPPADGWRVQCACGWSAQPFARSFQADQAYREHLMTVVPHCSDCGTETFPYRRSKSAAHLCKSCSYKRTKAWKQANPKMWERSARKSHLQKQYGLSVEDYEALLAQQRGKCAICGSEPGDSRGFRPHVDHCHETGRVRGILCGRCNIGLGSFRDDPNLLCAAISYLQRPANKE